MLSGYISFGVTVVVVVCFAVAVNVMCCNGSIWQVFCLLHLLLLRLYVGLIM